MEPSQEWAWEEGNSHRALASYIIQRCKCPVSRRPFMQCFMQCHILLLICMAVRNRSSNARILELQDLLRLVLGPEARPKKPHWQPGLFFPWHSGCSCTAFSLPKRPGGWDFGTFKGKSTLSRAFIVIDLSMQLAGMHCAFSFCAAFRTNFQTRDRWATVGLLRRKRPRRR